MHILLVGVKPKISDPHFKFHVWSTFEEVKESALILMPEYILIHENEACNLLPLAEEIPVKFVVIIENSSLSTTAIRSWTALGASDVSPDSNHSPEEAQSSSIYAGDANECCSQDWRCTYRRVFAGFDEPISSCDHSEWTGVQLHAR